MTCAHLCDMDFNDNVRFWNTVLPGKPVDPWTELVLVPPLLDPEPSLEFRTKKRFANFVREAELSNLQDFPAECNSATEKKVKI